MAGGKTSSLCVYTSGECVCVCMHAVQISPSSFSASPPLPSSSLFSLSSFQVCIYFCGMFICVLAGQPWYSLQGLMLGTLALSGFFTYEVCRKLDPTLPLVCGREGDKKV